MQSLETYTLNQKALNALLPHLQKILKEHSSYRKFADRLACDHGMLYISQANNKALLRRIAGVFNSQIDNQIEIEILFEMHSNNPQDSGIIIITKKDNPFLLINILRRIKKLTSQNINSQLV